MQSTAGKRLLCGKGFEKMIEDASHLGLEELEKHLKEIKLNDLEVRRKFKLLGLMENNVAKEVKKLVDQVLVPDFTRIAKTFKFGKYFSFYTY